MPETIKRQFNLLDLYCGAGGASHGYWIAGLNPHGIDFKPFRRYPYTQDIQDVLTLTPEYLAQFDVIHASPPCQIYSTVNNMTPDAVRVDLIPETRDLIFAALAIKPDLLYIIENVAGAPLIDPVMLCGANFGIKTYRHRFFETNFMEPEDAPPHITHVRPQALMGRRPLPFEFMNVIGITSDVVAARECMGIQWMKGEELSEAVPPAYTSYIGSFARTHLDKLHAGKPLFTSKQPAT